jgi:hypothetical protein
MRIRLAVAAAVAVVCLSVSPAVYAASSDTQPPVHAMFDKGKTVKLALRNDSGSPLELKVGDQVVSIAQGKTVSIKAQVGARILVNAATPKHQAGELLAEVSTALDNTTLTIK